MADNQIESVSIPPVLPDPMDILILEVFETRGPTYHINVSKELDEDISHVSRRCKDLTDHGLLDRRDRTYYALTERGEQFLTETSLRQDSRPDKE